MDRDYDAVIVGAGPAGASAATWLARAGWSVALIDKQRFPRRKVCGECIAASNLPLLAQLGIGDAFEARAGAELRQVVLMRGEHEVLADLPVADHARYPWGRALGRETLDSWLVERARQSGAQVLQPWKVRSLTGKAGDWRCEVRAVDTGATMTLGARVAIDAHGSWCASPADRTAQRRACKSGDLFAFKANFVDADLRGGVLPVLSLHGGYGGMVVADAGMTTLACCVRRDRLDALRRAAPGFSAGDVVQAWLMRECTGVRRALAPARRDGAWLAAGPIDPGIRLDDADGPFRIGNAAGEAHPILGEGISMALQSAALLCHALAGRASGPALCDPSWQRATGRAYAQAWRRAFVPRLRIAAAFAHAAMRPVPAGLLMAVATNWPGLLTQGARWGGKVRHAAMPMTAQAAR